MSLRMSECKQDSSHVIIHRHSIVRPKYSTKVSGWHKESFLTNSNQGEYFTIEIIPTQRCNIAYNNLAWPRTVWLATAIKKRKNAMQANRDSRASFFPSRQASRFHKNVGECGYCEGREIGAYTALEDVNSVKLATRWASLVFAFAFVVTSALTFVRPNCTAAEPTTQLAQRPKTTATAHHTLLQSLTESQHFASLTYTHPTI